MENGTLNGMSMGLLRPVLIHAKTQLDARLMRCFTSVQHCLHPLLGCAYLTTMTVATPGRTRA